MSVGTKQLGEAIDELLRADVGELTDGELHDLVVALQQQRNRLEAVSAAAISAWDQRMIWADNGSKSGPARLSNERPASSISSARVDVRRARNLRAMPAMAEALADGRLSIDHVDLLAKANQPSRAAVFAEYERDLVEHCTNLRFNDARKVIEYWCLRVDATGEEDRAERQREATHLDVSDTLDGTVVLNGVFDPINGAIVQNELRRLEHTIYLADKTAGVIRTASQRRAAALVEMATRSAIAPAGGQRPRPLFTALVGDESVSQLCELSNGKIVTPGQLERWAETADLESVLFDGPSTIISVSKRRTFTGALRRAIEVRDRHCQHRSGCDEPADDCDVDHITPHAHGGPTSQFDGRLECMPHNRNSDLHDHDVEPMPERPVDRLDELRCRLRWRLLHEPAEPVDAAS